MTRTDVAELILEASRESARRDPATCYLADRAEVSE